MTVTLFTKPSCGPCMGVKHALQSRGIPFRVVDVTADAEAAAKITRMGYRSVPVVMVSEAEHWSGFDMERINRLADRMPYLAAGNGDAA